MCVWVVRVEDHHARLLHDRLVGWTPLVDAQNERPPRLGHEVPARAVALVVPPAGVDKRLALHPAVWTVDEDVERLRRQLRIRPVSVSVQTDRSARGKLHALRNLRVHGDFEFGTRTHHAVSGEVQLDLRREVGEHDELARRTFARLRRDLSHAQASAFDLGHAVFARGEATHPPAHAHSLAQRKILHRGASLCVRTKHRIALRVHIDRPRLGIGEEVELLLLVDQRQHRHRVPHELRLGARSIRIPAAVRERYRVVRGEVFAHLLAGIVHAHANFVWSADDRGGPFGEDAARTWDVAPYVVFGVVERTVERASHYAERAHLARHEVAS